MPANKSSSSAPLVVIIIAVVLLGLPLLACVGFLFLGVAMVPTPAPITVPKPNVPQPVITPAPTTVDEVISEAVEEEGSEGAVGDER